MSTKKSKNKLADPWWDKGLNLVTGFKPERDARQFNKDLTKYQIEIKTPIHIAKKFN